MSDRKYQPGKVFNSGICAPPVWANLAFRVNGRDRVTMAAAVHGLPPIGAFFDFGHHEATDSFLAGTVVDINYGPTTDGSFKATVVIEAKP